MEQNHRGDHGEIKTAFGEMHRNDKMGRWRTAQTKSL